MAISPLVTQSDDPATLDAALSLPNYAGLLDGQAVNVGVGGLVSTNDAGDNWERVNLGPSTLYHKVVVGTSADAAVVKATPGTVRSIHITNNRTSRVYLKFHNSASTPTAGASVVGCFGCQGGAERSIMFPRSWKMTAGIAITIVTGIADNDANAVTAGDCSVEIEYGGV